MESRKKFFLTLLIGIIAISCFFFITKTITDMTGYASLKVEENFITEYLNYDGTALYFFWGNGCGSCAKQKSFLNEMQKKYPNIKIGSFEVWNNMQNSAMFSDFLTGFNVEELEAGVPAIFIGGQSFIGYSSSLNTQIESAIKNCEEAGCINAAKKVYS